MAQNHSQPQHLSELISWANSNGNMEYDHRVSVSVDRQRFIQTRNALTNAFMSLSGALDHAVKAYIQHTNAVLDGEGGNTLDVSGLLQPFNQIGHVTHLAQQAQQAILQNGNITSTPAQQTPGFNPDGSKKKRQYKPRDPNAPKRPLTAYFRYLQEQRPIISRELQAQGPHENGKAGDISKIATERWNSLDEKTRKPYRAAYESELGAYNAAVRAYKNATGQDIDVTQIDDEDAILRTPAPAQATAAAENDSSDDDESSSDEDESDGANGSESASSSSSEDEPTPPPPPKPKSKSPEVSKKTPKSAAKKTAKAGADPVAPAQQFSSLHVPHQAPPVEMTASSSKKRKGGDVEAGETKKKRSRKSMAEQQQEDAAAAAAQLQIDPQLAQLSSETPKIKKEKKKKRKSEAVAGA